MPSDAPGSDIALPQVEDINTDPDILEINLEAKVSDIEVLPGRLTPVWGYNGGLPGPLIKLKVGDRLIVHFTNNLPEETTIHWHGVRVPNAMDGAPGYTQAPIAANGGRFTYDFVVEDAGTFWYHPHVNSAAQVGKGLYGPMVVTDPKDNPKFGDDQVLILSDMSLDKQGRFLSTSSGGSVGDLFGREGSVLLVNGKVMPTLKVRQGEQQRWRIINAARSRYYTLKYGAVPFVKLGGDSGLAARASRAEAIKLVPGERADLVFTPSDRPGTKGVLRWLPTNRGFGSLYNRPAQDMMVIETIAEAPLNPVNIAGRLRQIKPIDTRGALEREIRLTIEAKPDSIFEMGINGVHYRHSKPLIVHVGDTEIWTVRNETDFSHPFHIHGFFFQVLDDSRVLEWKDTIDVPSKSSIRLAVHFDDRPGMWMYHCHILDHAEIGMMGHLRVLPRGVDADTSEAPHRH